MARVERIVKISDDQVIKIRELAAQGIRRVRIAERYGVSKSHITAILAGRRRRNVTSEQSTISAGEE